MIPFQIGMIGSLIIGHLRIIPYSYDATVKTTLPLGCTSFW
jgi:hypothetical protein